MFYETKPTSRKEIRIMAKLFREICGYSEDEPIDPVELLDRLPDINGFQNVCYEIIPDNKLPSNVPGECEKNSDGYIIKIKESVYNGAYERRIGGHRMHIIHEILHPFVDNLGFKPIFTRHLSHDTPPYRSLEWIVMALSGEVMMPYESTIDLSEEKIMEIYGVSKQAANYRKHYEKTEVVNNMIVHNKKRKA